MLRSLFTHIWEAGKWLADWLGFSIPWKSAERQADRRANKLNELPHWASVAFVALCAEWILPILKTRWPQCPEESMHAVLAAIDLARQSAADGALAQNSAEIDVAITSLNGRLTLKAHGQDVQNVPDDAALCGRIAEVVTVAAKCTEAARAELGRAQGIALEGYGWACEVAANSPDLLQQLNREYRQIWRAAERGNWNHRTRVERLGDYWVGTTPH